MTEFIPSLAYRCYDDQCGVRATCRWWLGRLGEHGKLAMTWRLGYEDRTLPCRRWESAKTVEHCVTYE